MLPVAVKAVIGGAAIASGATAAVSQWVSVGAGVATIIGAGFAIWTARRRRRRPPPRPPARGATEHEWEIYGARIDQYYEDRNE